MGLTALRYLPAAAVSLILLMLLYPLPVIISAWRREWSGIGLYGLTGVLGYNIALNYGEVRIAAGTASLIVGLSPVLTLIAARVFLGERITSRKLWGITIAFIGLFIVVRWGSHEAIGFDYLLEVLITLGAPLSWVAYTIVGKPLVGRSDATLVTLSAIVWGSLPLLFFVPNDILTIPSRAWMALGFLSLICTVFGFLVWSWALKKTEASRLGAVVYLIPLATVASNLILFGEPPTWGLAIGGLTLMAGVALAEL